MTHRRVRSARRVASVCCALFAAASLAAGCGGRNVGDGSTDDGTSAPVLGSAGSAGNKTGSSNHVGATGKAGAAVGGSSGAGGSSGLGGLGGGAKGGSGGSGGKAGAAGSGGVTGSSGATSSGGSLSVTAGSAGTATTSGGSDGTGGGDAGGGTTASAGSSGFDGGGGARSLTCGDGVIQIGEQCDDMGPSPACSNDCVKVSDAACVACENAGTCVDSVNNCLGPAGPDPDAGPGFSDAQQTQCYAVMLCILKSQCFAGNGTLGGTCYCGSLSTADCQAAPFDLTQPGAPNGPCAAVIQAGMPGVTANTAVLGNDLTKNTLPAGAAMQRLRCQKTADTETCQEACSVFPG